MWQARTVARGLFSAAICGLHTIVAGDESFLRCSVVRSSSQISRRMMDGPLGTTSGSQLTVLFLTSSEVGTFTGRAARMKTSLGGAFVFLHAL